MESSAREGLTSIGSFGAVQEVGPDSVLSRVTVPGWSLAP